MTDITMCTGDGCPAKGKCRRHTTHKGDWQSWFQQPPYVLKEKDGIKYVECYMFWGENQEYIYNQLKDIYNGRE